MLTEEAISLLKQLIAIPSFSKEEDKTADLIQNFLENKGIETSRKGYNIWASNKHFSKEKPTLLLNSHHDTVKPNAGYTNNPFEAIEKEGKLYGLGSNDAGGPLVASIATFLHFYEKDDLQFNLILACTAEEEISGQNGVASILDNIGNIDLAIVGEPTQMQMAIAEKGLIVLDCVSYGKAGHAAREEGENAIYNAMQDIEWFKNYQFDKESKMLGPIKMSVTQIEAGQQHNVVPDQCKFIVDVRTTDVYTNEETLEIIKQHISSEVQARSTRLSPSGIDSGHRVLQVAKELKIKTYGSPTLSDQALMPFPSVKIGPGKSERSHTADEYIEIKEIEDGIELYIKLIDSLHESYRF